MELITSKEQTKLLAKMGTSRTTKRELSEITGLSIPTVRKITNSTPPIIVQKHAYNAITGFIAHGKDVAK